MPSHSAILSIYDAFRKAQIDIPVRIGGLNTTNDIGENAITLNHVDEANNVAVAVRGHFASNSYDLKTKHQADLITKMYHTAVESAYYNATFFHDATPVDSQKEIQDLKDKIRDLERRIGPGRDSVVEKIDSVQITAENVQTTHRNSYRGYTGNFCPLKKVTPGSGFDLANAVRLKNENSTTTTLVQVTAEVGSTPPNFNGRITKYSDEDILKMIVFYNDSFGITRLHALPERISKFRSFLSGYEEM